MVVFFILMVFLILTVVFGNKREEVVPVVFFVELYMFNQIIYAHNIPNIDMQALKQH